jgi:hypothetical protein
MIAQTRLLGVVKVFAFQFGTGQGMAIEMVAGHLSYRGCHNFGDTQSTTDVAKLQNVWRGEWKSAIDATIGYTRTFHHLVGNVSIGVTGSNGRSIASSKVCHTLGIESQHMSHFMHGSQNIHVQRRGVEEIVPNAEMQHSCHRPIQLIG